MRDRKFRMGLGWSALVVALTWAGVVAAAGDDRCVEPPPGMTAWWPGEGSAVDLVGSWHGTLVGDTVFTAGEIGDAFLFDGSGDRVDNADASAGDFGADPFSVSFWMTSTSLGSGTYLIGKSHPDCCAAHGWDIRLDAGKIAVVGVNGWAVNITSEAVIGVDQWHHVAVTATDSEVILYIDGTVAGSSARQTITTAPNPLRFGHTTNFGGSALQGQLDEIQLYDRALSPIEVQVLSEAAPGGNCRPCAALPEGAVAWWRAEDNFDDGVGRFNGMPYGGVAFADGSVGRAFVFDGSDDVVKLPDDAVWDFGAGSFSITAWFKSSGAANGNLIRYHNGSSGDFWGVRLNDVGTNLQFLIGTPQKTITSTSGYADGSWHSATAVRDAAAGELRLYVDGAEAAAPVSDGGVSIVAATNAVAALGAGVWGATGDTFEEFAGSIDEVAVFDRALTAEEAAAIYAAGAQGICHGCAEPPDGLVSWWRGDGNAFDVVAANDGDLQNNATYAAGLVGQAISLPAGSDFVEIPHDDSLSFGATDPMSIALWAYRATDDAAQHLLSKRYDCYATPWNYQLAWESGPDRMCFGSASGYVCTTADKLPLAEWTHLAVSFDGAVATFYVNGLPEATAAITLGPDTNSPPLRFGSVADCDTLNQGFRGLLDEIELYDRALTRNEVLAVYRAGGFGRCTDCAPVPAGLEAWWRAEGDATDAANSNDGTEMNGAGYGPGRVGRAFDLDDTAPEYLEVPHSASLDITGAFSVESWVQVDQMTQATVVAKGDANGSESVSPYGLSISGWSIDGKVNGVLYGSYPADWYLSDENIEAGRWHHLAFTWDGSTSLSDNVNLYIDGRHAQSWTKVSSMVSSTESLTIGAMKPPTYHRKTDGRIDELSIYSAELTAAEIRAIVAAGGAGKCVDGDTAPDPFVFFDSTGHQPNTIVGTDPITVSGIDQPAEVAITACTSVLCWYAVNDGGWTIQPGTVKDGDAVYVRLMTAATQDTTTDLTLSIGGVSDTFSATTYGNALFSDSFESGDPSAWSSKTP